MPLAPAWRGNQKDARDRNLQAPVSIIATVDDGGEGYGSRDVDGALVTADGDAVLVFELSELALDRIARLIGLGVER
jgi:hypothetical protein